MSIDISVIVPLYNKEEFIERTLRSVVAQDIDNWECIIVDDGSTDASLKIVKQYIQKNPANWKVATQENSGQTRARNHGVSLAAGKYLTFLDADDLWPSNKLRLQIMVLEDNPKAVLVLSAFAIFKDHASTPRVVRHKNPTYMNKRWLLMSGFGGGLESVGMVRRNALLEREIFDPTLSTSSGLDLSLRLAKLGQVILLPQIGLYYRINPGQWHADTKELCKNLEILGKRYQGGVHRDIAKSHAAYLFWISARGRGKKYLVLSLLQALIDWTDRRFFMLMNLVSRNVISMMTGKSMKKETLAAVRLLDSKSPQDMPLPAKS